MDTKKGEQPERGENLVSKAFLRAHGLEQSLILLIK